MIEVITREWEIAKTYIFDVALRAGLINLDWNDFELKARYGKPAVAVKIDEPLKISEMVARAIDEINERIKGELSSVMVVISFKEGEDIKMDELGAMNVCLERLADENVDIAWGVQKAEEISNRRCVTVFAFEKL